MPKRRNNSCALWGQFVLVLLLCFSSPALVAADPVILHLVNGDRITGEITSETTNSLTIVHKTFGKLTFPTKEIARREPAVQPALPTGVSGVPPAQTQSATTPNLPAGAFNTTERPSGVPDPATNKVAAAPTAPPLLRKPQEEKPKGPKVWNTEIQFGLNVRYSQRDQQEFLVLAKSTYAKAPFRHIFDYTFNYGKTEGLVTGNRMSGSQKTEYDLTKKVYLFNLMGAGYDEIRKIDLQYEFNPGVGMQLINSTNWNFVLKNELGFGYQEQLRDDERHHRSYSARIAEIFSWKVPHTKIVADGKVEFFPDIQHFGEYRLRLEGTVRYPLSTKLSFNVIVIDQYDTQPAKGIDKNDLQLRSTLGLRF